MAATRPETTLRLPCSKLPNRNPLGPLYLPITSVSFLVVRAAVRQAAELGRPPMVAKHEGNEAPDCCVPLLFYFQRPKTLIKSKAQMHTACTQPNNHHVQLLPIILVHFRN